LSRVKHAHGPKFSQFLTELGLEIRKARDREGITQGELADRSGVSRSSIANIEGGRNSVSLSVVFALAAPLGVQVRDLIPMVRRQVLARTNEMPQLDATLEEFGAFDG
jgi:transcriptional regulator with XRE-family HTH domain